MELEREAIVGHGRFRVEGLLGKGGMAAVYCVRHLELDTQFALKVITAASPEATERMIREGRAQARLRHPNVVPVVDVLAIEDSPGLLMEYIPGPTLERALSRVPRLSVPQVDVLARGILAGVEEAHAAGFVHRDLKPGNILLAISRSGVIPRITDFGLVKSLAPGDAPTVTRSGAIMGTPAYMAPEQIRSSATVDERADIFSLGVILYELLTGRRPFAGGDPYELLRSMLEGSFVPPSAVIPGLPARMDRAVLGALITDPSARWASVASLRAAWEGRTPSPDPAMVWSEAQKDQIRDAAPPGTPEATSGHFAREPLSTADLGDSASDAPLEPAAVPPAEVLEQRPAPDPPAGPEVPRVTGPGRFIPVFGTSVSAVLLAMAFGSGLAFVAALCYQERPVESPITDGERPLVAQDPVRFQLDGSFPFTSVEVSCPSASFRAQAAFEDQAATIWALPADVSDCVAMLRGGPPVKVWGITPGQTFECRANAGYPGGFQCEPLLAPGALRIALHGSTAFTGVEVSCPSERFLANSQFTDRAATVDAVPAANDCVAKLQGGPPLTIPYVHPGQTWYCTATAGLDRCNILVSGE